MNITINRQELLAAAKRAAAVAPPASPLDTLRGVLLETDPADGVLTLSATNMEMAIEQKIRCAPRGEDAVVINAAFLEQLVEKLAGDTVTLQRQGKKPHLTITSAEASFEVPVWERGSFPKVEIPFPEDTVKLSGLPAIAKRTAFAVGSGEGKPLLKCVNLMFTQNGLKAACSDGNCIVTARGDDESTGDISLLVPAHSLEKLARMSADTTEYRVGTTGKSIVFFRENFAFSARIMEGEYIDTERLLAAVSDHFTVLTDVPELRHCLYSVIAVEPNGKVMLCFDGSTLVMRCDGAYGSAASQMEVIPLTGSPQGEYCFLSRHLSACLRALDGTVTLGIAQGGMLTLSTENAYYLQTGVRTTEKKAEQPSAKSASRKRKKAA